MKTFLQVLLFITIAFSLQAQVVTTSPEFVTLDKSVTITFDATKGNAGLNNNAEDWYAHTGVITDKSAGNWAYVKTPWPSSTNLTQANTGANRLTKIGGNKGILAISDIRAYYGVPAGEKILKLCFVFRNPAGTKEGKDTGNKDIFVNVYEPGLQTRFTAPAAPFQLINKAVTVSFAASASQSTQLKLYIDKTQIASATGTTISQSYKFDNEGSYWAIVEAGTAPNLVRDSMFVNVKKAVETAARPSLPDGINIVNNNTVTFILYAPNKTNVFLVGDFNKWLPRNDYMMKKDGNYWWLTVNTLQPNVEYAFQYLVNENLYVGDAYAQKVLDPWNDKYIPSSTYPNLKPYPAGKDTNDGMVSVFQTNETPYSWSVTNFQGPRQDKLVIYELLLRDFTASSDPNGVGDLNGAMAKLDYLQGLGINAIELMPTQEFDGNDSWGYNPCYYFAMDKAYGTKAMYKKFIDECHKRGIAVILDVVYNHATGLHPFAKLYWNAATNKTTTENPWFNVDAPHAWSVFHDFKHNEPLVRNYFKRNLKFLLEEYKFDGFRFDLTKGFTQTAKSSTNGDNFNFDQSRIDILKDYNSYIKSIKPNAYMILEHFCADSEERALAEAGMMPWGKMIAPYGQSAMGWPTGSDFIGVNGWTRGWNYNNLVGYMESHDEERIMYKVKTNGATSDIKTNLAVQMDRVALNAAFFLPLPGAKMIWQFGELGYDYSKFSKAGSTTISSDNETARKEIRWDYFSMPERRRVYDTYYKLNKLREQYGNAFDNSSYWQQQISDNDWAQGRRICLNSSDLKMVIVGNFNVSGSVNTNPNFPVAGTWYDLMDGSTMNVTSSNLNPPINLAAGKFKVLTNKKINIPNGIDDVKKGNLTFHQSPDYPDYLTIVSEEPVFAAKIYNINGVLLKQSQNENKISITNLPKGCYILNVQLSGQNHSFKFIKSNCEERAGSNP